MGVAATACSGERADGAATAPTTAVRAEQVVPAEFAAVVADEDVVTVNVHVPDEGSIPGTDAAIPFDQITTSVGKLPEERSTPLAVYCRTGSMSTEAVQTLRDLGYTDLVELRGGMDAWTADGRELLSPVD
ncbi:UNVERIFIED_ORG: rhodanese-like domain-containing protein [Bacillus sp. AZ43]